MGKLYETAQRIDAAIERQSLEKFRTRGRISMEVGFPLGLITPATPDDETKLRKLQQAATQVLGETF